LSERIVGRRADLS
jgi:hypothetical protein